VPSGYTLPTRAGIAHSITLVHYTDSGCHNYRLSQQ